MNIWIVTTGNSDVILRNDKNWVKEFYPLAKDELDCKKFSQPDPIDKDNKQLGYTAPARVFGQVYGNQAEYYKSDLDFPLFNTFSKYFQDNNIELDKIIILLTNQEKIFFEKEARSKQSPYWQDTHTLKPIIKWYFQKNKAFELEPDFRELAPNSGHGLSHWNETLLLVQDVFKEIQHNSEEMGTVYVSHQAGTPAISSAVQFVSLNKFQDKVKFILSNKYYDLANEQESKVEEVIYPQVARDNNASKPEEINNVNSGYWRDLQIQKVKPLITSGFPGAALTMLNGLERIDQKTLNSLKEMVDFFNLHSVEKDNTKDFEVAKASQRIIDSLELIEFFFEQNNYLQGISLLAAAQETFLKVAIIHETAKLTTLYRGVAISELISWKSQGLFLTNDYQLKQKLNLTENEDLEYTKKTVLNLLKFPTGKHSNGNKLYTQKKSGLEFNRFGMQEWLCELKRDFKPWEHLRASDLRNQLMHNLRGMEDETVIKYLLDSSITAPSSNVKSTYINHVKDPFLKGIELLELPCECTKLQKELTAIADSLS